MLNPFQKAIAVTALLGSTLMSEMGRADEPPLPLPSAQASSRVLVSKRVGNVGVTIDFAKLLSFDQPARTIIIGNPSIVDGTLSDEHTLVLTGKAIGTTNMIVLGEMGQEIANMTVSVGGNTNQLTTVYHGATLQVFSCAGPCRPLAPPAASASGNK